MLDNFLRLGVLFDFYGALLTKKQQECLMMHLYQDWSLSEIADSLAISRQSAHDMLHRCEITLEKYEAKLHLIARHKILQDSLRDISADINSLKNDFQIKKLNDADEKIKELLNS